MISKFHQQITLAPVYDTQDETLLQSNAILLKAEVDSKKEQVGLLFSPKIEEVQEKKFQEILIHAFIKKTIYILANISESLGSFKDCSSVLGIDLDKEEFTFKHREVLKNKEKVTTNFEGTFEDLIKKDLYILQLPIISKGGCNSQKKKR